MIGINFSRRQYTASIGLLLENISIISFIKSNIFLRFIFFSKVLRNLVKSDASLSVSDELAVEVFVVLVF